MNTFELTITGNAREFLEKFLRITTNPMKMIQEAAPRHVASFRQKVWPLEVGKVVTVYVTTLRELFGLNGLSYVEAQGTEATKEAHLAVPNFLAELQGFEPLGHELALEIFGQGLHYSAIPLVKSGFVICTTHTNNDRGDAYSSTAIRLQQEEYGDVVAYPTTHVARYQDRMMLLYVKKGTVDSVTDRRTKLRR